MTSPISPGGDQMMADGPLDDQTLNTLRIMAYAVKCHLHDGPPCMHCFGRLISLGAHALALLDRITELELPARQTKALPGQGNPANHRAEPRYDLIAEAGFWLAPEVGG